MGSRLNVQLRIAANERKSVDCAMSWRQSKGRQDTIFSPQQKQFIGVAFVH
jgi:hypothetical protein